MAERLQISRCTVRRWRTDSWRPPELRAECFRCTDPAAGPPDDGDYAHLLGLYLGDGHISHLRRDVEALRIACCDAHPRLIDECEAVMRSVRAGPVSRVPAQGCTYVAGYWKHWSCVFPQHGPGRQHDRSIVLEQWQQDIVDRHPGRLLRGLFHSDGCRVQNWGTGVNGQRYDGYSRYLFDNRSTDILALCCATLRQMEIPHRHPRGTTISVARRAAVALLDEHVGPKS